MSVGEALYVCVVVQSQTVLSISVTELLEGIHKCLAGMDKTSGISLLVQALSSDRALSYKGASSCPRTVSLSNNSIFKIHTVCMLSFSLLSLSPLLSHFCSFCQLRAISYVLTLSQKS